MHSGRQWRDGKWERTRNYLQVLRRSDAKMSIQNEFTP